MVPRRPITAALAALLALAAAACGDDRPLASREASGREPGYLTPPEVQRAVAGAQAVRISGHAPPRARLRLASPSGEAMEAAADQKGSFAFDVPAGATPRLFGLSMSDGERRVQAQGYLLVTPARQAALLRAGAAAERLDMGSRQGIGAFDFDAAGAATVAGRAPPNAGLSIRLNGRQALEARSDAEGRYTAALPNLQPGPHRIEVVGDGFTQTIVVELSAAAPLTEAPMRAGPAPGGLRVDWITPGGGLQSTIIAD